MYRPLLPAEQDDSPCRSPTDIVDDSFSPLRKNAKKARRFPTGLDTPLGAHKEIEPLWGDDAAGPPGIAGGGLHSKRSCAGAELW